MRKSKLNFWGTDCFNFNGWTRNVLRGTIPRGVVTDMQKATKSGWKDVRQRERRKGGIESFRPGNKMSFVQHRFTEGCPLLVWPRLSGFILLPSTRAPPSCPSQEVESSRQWPHQGWWIRLSGPHLLKWYTDHDVLPCFLLPLLPRLTRFSQPPDVCRKSCLWKYADFWPSEQLVLSCCFQSLGNIDNNYYSNLNKNTESMQNHRFTSC